MSQQQISSCKTSRAFRALEGFLLGMGPFMSLQMLQPCKGPPARSAYVRPGLVRLRRWKLSVRGCVLSGIGLDVRLRSGVLCTLCVRPFRLGPWRLCFRIGFGCSLRLHALRRFATYAVTVSTGQSFASLFACGSEQQDVPAAISARRSGKMYKRQHRRELQGRR